MSGLTEREREIRRRLKIDFDHYASRCLSIRNKAGQVVPLALNASQRHVHERLEEQRRNRGRVRALVLKARQWGCSTYVEGRFYWRVTHSRGVRAFILTHLQDATDNLFGMVERFHENCPDLVKPSTGASNAKELAFDLLDSGYKVATAGSRAVGRSDTIQLFHGSEVAFWPNAGEHMAGVLQAVPDAYGTEVILESTANGIGGVFYDLCMSALEGDGDYELIFVPWHWHEEYAAEPPGGWKPAAAWEEYGRLHGLDASRLYWAYSKNAVLAKACGGTVTEPCWQFKQEYPATVHEAFQASGADGLIRPDLVLKARKHEAPDQSAEPLVLGVDVARGGGDKTRIVDRMGRCAGYLVNETMDTDDLMEVAGRVVALIRQHNPAAVFVDVTGIGAGVYDRLKEMNYREVHGVNFGSRARQDSRYANRRAEMWSSIAEWLSDPGGVDLPDGEEWQKHLCAPGVKFDSLSRVLLEKKEDIKARLGFSPDLGDALALTFADPVRVQARGRGPRPVQAQSYNPIRRR